MNKAANDPSYDIIKRFVVGLLYTNSSIGDANAIFSAEVTKRTEKSVWVSLPNEGALKRCKIHTYNGEEFILPWGSYSKAPRLKAGKVGGVAQ